MCDMHNNGHLAKNLMAITDLTSARLEHVGSVSDSSLCRFWSGAQRFSPRLLPALQHLAEAFDAEQADMIVSSLAGQSALPDFLESVAHSRAYTRTTEARDRLEKRVRSLFETSQLVWSIGRALDPFLHKSGQWHSHLMADELTPHELRLERRWDKMKRGLVEEYGRQMRCLTLASEIAKLRAACGHYTGITQRQIDSQMHWILGTCIDRHSMCLPIIDDTASETRALIRKVWGRFRAVVTFECGVSIHELDNGTICLIDATTCDIAKKIVDRDLDTFQTLYDRAADQNGEHTFEDLVRQMCR